MLNNGGAGTKMTIVTDRAVYKPGDKVHVKVYARSQQGTEMVVPTATYSMQVRWKGYNNPAVVTPVALGADTGAYHATLTIPEDATYGNTQLSIGSAIESDGKRSKLSIYGASASITIADPRPPTVVMKLSIVKDQMVVGKKGSVGIKLSTRTYAGTAVAGQQIEVKWSASSTIKGVIAIVTTADGTGVGDFTLPEDADEFVNAGDKISFKATWVGPTREVVDAETSIIISESKWAISLANSPQQPLPGYEFGSTVAITEMGTDAAQEGVAVSVTLYHAKSATASSTTVPSANGDIMVGDKVGATCTMAAGAGVGCPLALQATGAFVVVACATADPDGKQICASTKMGRTAEQWAYSPLTSLSQISLAADKQSYTQGEVAKFSFVNPFKNARAMVVWGNRISRKTRVTELLEGGKQTISVAIGAECRGGCRVNIVLSVPTQDSLPTLPVDLAFSSMFDATLAQRITSTHTLAVVGESTEITVGIKVDTAITKPGQAAGFTVELKDAFGKPVSGEVAVFVVDKAFLDVKPHPSQDLNEKFKLDLQAPARKMVSNTNDMIGGKTYDKSKARIHTLDAKDKWITPSWPLRAGENQQFDLAVDDYLERRTGVWITTQPPSSTVNVAPPPPPMGGGSRDDFSDDDGIMEFSPSAAGGPPGRGGGTAPVSPHVSHFLTTFPFI